MTNSGNDRKAPPGGPKRPAPAAPVAPAKPQPAAPRVGGAAVGGAAAGRPQPAAQGARPQPPGARPAPPARPQPHIEDIEPEAKTSAINLADLGLESDEATVSVDADSIRAKAAAAQRAAAAPPRPQPARAAPSEEAEEKTTAFNLNDLPPEEEPKRPPQKTLLGHPAPKPGAAVSGGAAVRGAPQPARRQETVAIAKAPAPAPIEDDIDNEAKTSAMNMDDMLARIEGESAAKAAPAEPVYEEEKTSALSPEDIKRLEAAKAARAGGARPAPAPARPAPAPAPASEYEEEKTAAISPEDMRKFEAAKAARAAGGRPGAAPAPSRPTAGKAGPMIEESERTMAVSLDDVGAIDDAPAPVRKAAQVAQKAQPARAAAAVEEAFEEEIVSAPKPKAKPAAGAKPGAAAAKPAGKPGAKPAAAGAGKRPSMAAAFDSNEGFVGAIRYALAYQGLEAQMEAGVIPQQDLDPARRTAGYRNLIIVGGALAALMTVFAFL